MNPVIQEVTALSAATLIQKDDKMQSVPLVDLLSRKVKFSKELDFGGQEENSDNEYSIFMFDLESEVGEQEEQARDVDDYSRSLSENFTDHKELYADDETPEPFVFPGRS